LNVSLFNDALLTEKAEHCRSFSPEQTDISAGFTGLVQVTSKRTYERMPRFGQQDSPSPGIALLLYVYSFSNGCMQIEESKNVFTQEHFCFHGALTSSFPTNAAYVAR